MGGRRGKLGEVGGKVLDNMESRVLWVLESTWRSSVGS